jgi:hypothetical protein
VETRIKNKQKSTKKKINMYIDVGINVSCGGFYCSIIFSRVQRTYAIELVYRIKEFLIA